MPAAQTTSAIGFNQVARTIAVTVGVVLLATAIASALPLLAIRARGHRGQPPA